MYKFFFHLHLHQTKTNLIMKIVDLKLEANNLNTIVDFYQNVLGFTLNNKTDNTVSFQAGNTNLTFTKNQASTAQYHFAFNISEIGLVTQQPFATAKAINQQTNLEFFSKATPLPEFCAVGDDEGLIILVAPTRTWYPTTILATHSPAEIKIEVNEKIYTIQSTDWK